MKHLQGICMRQTHYWHVKSNQKGTHWFSIKQEPMSDVIVKQIREVQPALTPQKLAQVTWMILLLTSITMVSFPCFRDLSLRYHCNNTNLILSSSDFKLLSQWHWQAWTSPRHKLCHCKCIIRVFELCWTCISWSSPNRLGTELWHSATTTCRSDCCIHSVWQSIPTHIKFPEVASACTTWNHDSTDHACSRFWVGFFCSS